MAVKSLIELFLDNEGNLREDSISGPIADVKPIGVPEVVSISNSEYDCNSRLYSRKTAEMFAPHEATAFWKGNFRHGPIKRGVIFPVVYYKSPLPINAESF